MKSEYFFFYKEINGNRELDWFTSEGIIMHLFQSKYFIFNVDYAYIFDYDQTYETIPDFIKANIKQGKLLIEFEIRRKNEDKFDRKINIAQSPEELQWFLKSIESSGIEMIMNVIVEMDKLISLRNALTEELEKQLRELDNANIAEFRENIYFNYDLNKFDLK